ncbi:MAG: RlmE family RNA methyltransferase [Spirochaetales bacterium]|nr:RlmE family RNA methyltransferase [Spirochaetales bacterium]
MRSRKNKWDDDPYTRLAKQRGFPARSVFKLEEIQKKYAVIKKDDHVLDIGAAPGSWSMFVSRILNNRGNITGVDIMPIGNTIRFSSEFHFIQGNIFHADVFLSIIKYGPYNVILSDAAPFTTGNRLVDSTSSCELASRVIEIAGKCLKKGGNLVVKLLQGGDSGAVLMQMKSLFDHVKAYKPETSRKKSTEQYYIGRGYHETN